MHEHYKSHVLLAHPYVALDLFVATTQMLCVGYVL